MQHLTNRQIDDLQVRYSAKLATRRGRRMIADELERFARRLYMGQALPSAQRAWIEALRGERSHPILSESVREARVRWRSVVC